MNKIVFGTTEYPLMPSGYGESSGHLNILLFANTLELTEVEKVLLDKKNTEVIVVKDFQNRTIQLFRDYIVLDEIKKQYGYKYNRSVIEGEEKIDTADVIIIQMSKPGLKEQTNENTSNIDYIAIVEDIDLEVE